MVIIYFFIRCKKSGSDGEKSILKRLLSSGAYILMGIVGVFAAAIPQITINKNVLGKFSISVPTDNLMLTQMSWGFMYQRYDTYR